MFRPPDDRELAQENEADIALRQGLRRVPVPETSADFDAHVHAALRRPVPWWQTLWAQARPVLSTATCSLLATLALLRYGTATAPPGLPHSDNTVSAVASSRARERMEAMDQGIESGDLTAASLRTSILLHRPLPAKQNVPKEPTHHTVS